jgi:enolase
MPIIERLDALEILDSRGRPTVQATCTFANGISGMVSVPSGASTGAAEAHELRDGNPKRYRGLGCRKAIANIRGEMNQAFHRREFADQAELDYALIELDGTANKSRLGANAILAVSLAFARACAAEQPLYQYFAGNQKITTLPRPMINLFSGGKHAGGQIAIQDVQIMPLRTRTMDDTLAMTVEVFQTAAELVYKKYGMRLLTADEGGLAPAFADSETMIEAAVKAIEAAGLEPGHDVALTVDVAASHFYNAGFYQLGDERLDGSAMVEKLLSWLEKYPITSIEDGLAEDDWEHWSAFRSRTKRLVLGDDLLCTNPARIQKAINQGAANALLLKVNQIGTLTEAREACNLAKAAGWRVVVSARSGETEDNWLADLATGWAGDHIKVGSITQSERLAKYNRLLAIEAETGLPVIEY